MISKRLENLRDLLKQKKIDGYIVPTTDEYLSEYSPLFAKRLEYITGFTGSNGLAVILKETVLFFTDGRYITQCLAQLDNYLFEIFDQKLLLNFPWHQYVSNNDIIAYDPKLFTTRSLLPFSKINIKIYEKNLIDLIWDNQPKKPASKIYDYPIKYAGESHLDKITKCRKILKEYQATALIITSPDSSCWLLNIRAHDVEFSPLLLSYTIITSNKIYLFTDKNRVEKEIIASKPEIIILPEDSLTEVIAIHDGKILYDENLCSTYITGLIKDKNHKNINDPTQVWKACKNEVEINHMIDSHIQDAVAVCELLSYITNKGISILSEYDLGQKLTDFRAKREGYVMDSFPAICGYRENSAVIHYRASKETAKKLREKGILLIDSGGQYMGATTDITRTIVIGKPDKQHKHFYTKVLKGHITLGNTIFPAKKITGAHLDSLARWYLWQEGQDYAHGTGHGVGSYLSVHEGPQNISPLGFGTKLAKGMVLSNEPGYYVPGEFGIRIENMMYVKEAKHPDYLKFEMLTLVPYAKDLINQHMLSAEELSYIKNYYQTIQNKVMSRLSETAQKWLIDEMEWALGGS